jgi:hypothetical protein
LETVLETPGLHEAFVAAGFEAVPRPHRKLDAEGLYARSLPLDRGHLPDLPSTRGALLDG